MTEAEKTREQREAEAKWIIGRRGFFDHGAINDGEILAVISVLAPSHKQEEIFAVIQDGLQPKNLRTSRAFGWDDVAEVVGIVYSEFQQRQGSPADLHPPGGIASPPSGVMKE